MDRYNITLPFNHIGDDDFAQWLVEQGHAVDWGLEPDASSTGDNGWPVPHPDPVDLLEALFIEFEYDRADSVA